MPRQDYLLLPRARVRSVPMAWGHNDDIVLVKRPLRHCGGNIAHCPLTLSTFTYWLMA